MSPIIKINNLSYTYHTLQGETSAIDGITFSVDKGKFVSIVGPSGCGKSTLLSLIANLLTPSGGEITVDLQQVQDPKHPIGYMLQMDHLFEWRSIFQNLILGLEIANLKTKEYLDYVEVLLNKYGLSDFRNCRPSQLSGGMRQRAALIRTLALKPDILLLDEPFSALDYQTRLNVADDIYSIIKEEGKTALLVTHDISEAISMADQVIVLSKRPAKIKARFDIEFSIPNRTPFSVRSDPQFAAYFNKIWKELNEHDNF